jgi:hypothetical protein
MAVYSPRLPARFRHIAVGQQVDCCCCGKRPHRQQTLVIREKYPPSLISAPVFRDVTFQDFASLLDSTNRQFERALNVDRFGGHVPFRFTEAPGEGVSGFIDSSAATVPFPRTQPA